MTTLTALRGAALLALGQDRGGDGRQGRHPAVAREAAAAGVSGLPGVGQSDLEGRPVAADDAAGRGTGDIGAGESMGQSHDGAAVAGAVGEEEGWAGWSEGGGHVVDLGSPSCDTSGPICSFGARHRPRYRRVLRGSESWLVLTSEQIRAARALLRREQKTLADASSVSLPTIERLEVKPGPLGAHRPTVDTLSRALEAAGIIFIPADGDDVGARLRRERA